MDDRKISLPPHIVIFPFPLQWPLTSMFDLAELLSLAGLHVTFLLLPHTHTLLLRHTNVESRLNPHPNFRLQIISDGLPPDHPRSDAIELLASLETLTKPIFRELLTSGRLICDDRGLVSCIISDGILSFVYDVASEIRVPVISAMTFISPCCLWVLWNLCNGAGEVSYQIGGNESHSFIKRVSGLEGILTGKDLATMCPPSNFNPLWKHLMNQIQKLPRSHGLILNTFKSLDGPILSLIRSICPNLYAIGPIHAHLSARQEALRMIPLLNYSVEETNNCILWLDSQKPNSTLYVNIKNQAQLTREQVLELWHGLVNSGKGFLWVRPSKSIAGKSRIPETIRKGTKERGCIVDSSSNVHVLAHKAVGGFLTLEGVMQGVPMICLSSSWDEQVNRRFVSKVWKMGMHMEEKWDRNVIEKTIRDVMEVKGELMENANKMKKLATKCVSKGGSSYAMLDHLVDDLKLMHLKPNGL